jgi:hypothetical protein
VKLLYDEISTRFPEIRSVTFEDSVDQPYTMMSILAEWLRDMNPDRITSEMIQRVQAFSDWCCKQDQTEAAHDDIFTIWAIGFLENLFEDEKARRLLPKIIDRTTLLGPGAEYYKQWVGVENYEKALKHFT